MRRIHPLLLCWVAGAACALPEVPHASDLPIGTEPMLQAPAPSPPAALRRQPFDETVGLRAGGIAFGTFQTMASLDVIGTNAGTSVNLEDDLGLSGQTTSYRADAYWRPGRRHRIDAAWFTLDRSSTRVIEREINWGGEVFPIGTTVTGNLETDILQLRYSWYFLAADDYELGIGLGLYGMNVVAGLQGTGLGSERSFETPLPLPVLSLQGAWEMVPQLQLVGGVQFFFVQLESVGSVDDIEGSVVDAMIGVEYEFADHVGLGGAYNFFEIRTEIADDQLAFEFDYGYSALFLYMFVKI